ncbi:MAG TPA: SRPBCC domain-containing protein [Candidatus Thermoplasmatota archaeon]|nr:SRPBCC domain-containing protein [Candidatus Thermoplasmatota archaeon]
MTPANQSTKVLSDREFAITHEFDAPAAKVFAAYTDPKQVPQWWGPKGNGVRVEMMDVRPGGAWRFVQRGPDGRDFVTHGTYVEVKPVTRLVYTFQAESMPNEVTTTVELREAGGRTHLTLTIQASSKEERDQMVKYGASGGAKAAAMQLAEYLRTV